MIHRILESKSCDSVLRIGGIPTTRVWRDLEDKYKDIPVFSVSFNHYTGLSRPVQHVNSLDLLSQVEFSYPHRENVRLNIEDSTRAETIRALIRKYPESEQGMIFDISKKMKGASVYLGNSLPIREWDSCSSHDAMPIRVAGNRGANGIDGQISTFLGWAHPETENWCLVGDLTAMYDLSSLWVTSQLEARKFRIVVINNGGGQIFSRMFKKKFSSTNIKFLSIHGQKCGIGRIKSGIISLWKLNLTIIKSLSCARMRNRLTNSGRSTNLCGESESLFSSWILRPSCRLECGQSSSSSTRRSKNFCSRLLQRINPRAAEFF